jgi:hypothetical protein
MKRISALISVLLFLAVKYAVAQGYELATFEKNGKYGFKDKITGAVIYKPQFNSSSCLARCNYRIVTSGDNKDSNKKYIDESWSVIDGKTGEYVIKNYPNQLYEYGVAQDTIILGVRNTEGKLGLIFLDGRELLPVKCDNIGHPDDRYNYFFDYRLIPYKINGLWGLIDINGKEILKPEYSSIGYLSSHPDRRSVIIKNGKMGVLYSSGFVLPAIYDSIKSYDINTGKKQLIEKADDKLIFGKSIPLTERYLAVNQDGKSMVINGLGEVIPEDYLQKRKAEYTPPSSTPSAPTELEKEVARIANSFAPQKQEYRECMYCSGTGKSKEKQRTYKNCSVCGGWKRINFGTRTGVCTVCDKYGKVIDKEWYPVCQFCKGTGKLKNDETVQKSVSKHKFDIR